MTSFVHVDQPLQHAGLNRATAAFDNIRNAGQGATRFGLAFRLLIAAGVRSEERRVGKECVP